MTTTCQQGLAPAQNAESASRGAVGVNPDDHSAPMTWTVETAERLDAFLIRNLEGRGHSRVEVQGWIQDGRVAVARDGGAPGDQTPRVLKRSYKLKAGDVVTATPPPPPPPPEPLRAEDLAVPLIYQDAALLVLNKPAGLTVHPGAGNRHGTLVSALMHISPGELSSVGGEERPGIVHRLDKDTTGVIVVARTDAAHRELARQFHDREVKKTYLALTHGVPRKAKGVIDAPLGRHPKDRKRQAVVEGGRAAQTAYTTREAWARHAFVELRPKTGRTHQIRVHLKSLGTPILADATYGRSAAFTTRDAGIQEAPTRALLERHALHAASLSFNHPTSGERLTFEAPLPADMQATLAALRTA
jgi:23S rRNA pseudouridine1911/1915/1917 synthase